MPILPIALSMSVEVDQDLAEGSNPTWVTIISTILDTSFWTSVITVAGVVLGAFLTHKFTLSSKVQEDKRDRLVNAAMDSLQCANNIRRHFHEVAFHGPRGGGRIRDGSVPNAKWEKIPRKDAKEHDREAAAALGRISESTDHLRELNIVLTVFGPTNLSQSFNAIPNRIYEYFETVRSEGSVKGDNTAITLEDLDDLFEIAVQAVRDSSS